MVVKKQGIVSGWKDGTGVHCCYFYYGIPHLLSSVSSLVRMVLLQNNRCILSLDPELRRRVAGGLTAEGFDVAELERQDRLELFTETEIDQFYRTGVPGLNRQDRYWEKRLEMSGLAGQFMIGQAELAIKAIGWEAFLHYEREVGPVLEHNRMNLICLYPFARTCMGPYYKAVRAAHPQLLSAGNLLEQGKSMVGQTA